MIEKKAARGSCNYTRARGSVRTNSIIADAEAFRLVTWTLLFVASCMAVPTIMAVLKGSGVW